MAVEKTLVLIKPDGVFRALIGKVITTFEDAGLKVVGIKMVKPDAAFVATHYVADKDWLLSVGNKNINAFKERGIKLNETALEIGTRVRESLLSYLTSGPVVAMVIEGNSAIEVARKLAGATEPRKADPSSIRGKYSCESYEAADGRKRAARNILHASEDAKTAEHEIALWFKKSEITEYKRVDDGLIY